MRKTCWTGWKLQSGREETTHIVDTFILNMLDYKTQNELLKETLAPPKCQNEQITWRWELKISKKINQNLNNINNQSVYIVNDYQNRNRTINFQQQRHSYNCKAKAFNQNCFTNICRNCEQLELSPTTKLSCKRKKYRRCGISNHFAKICRKPKTSQSETSPPQQIKFN